MKIWVVAVLSMVVMTGCKKDHPTSGIGWDGSRMSDDCHYIPYTYSGALQNMETEQILVNYNAHLRPLDHIAVLVCYDVACDNPWRPTSCENWGLFQGCKTSLPSIYIKLGQGAIVFDKAYDAGLRGYFIHEMICGQG